MIYIVMALKSEAQAFVDYFKPAKKKLGGFSCFFHDDFKLILSGVGLENARMATQTLINNFDITDDDIYVNIGVCGADNSFEIGELIEIGEILHEGVAYRFDEHKESILCSLHAITEKQQCKIADMESYGFYDAIIHNPAIKKFHILKVVSDHFEPKSVTKEGVKMAIFNQIDGINKILKG